MALEVERPMPLPLMTEEEFERWCDEDTRAEFVDGKVILMSPAGRPHDQLVRFIDRLLGFYLETRTGGTMFGPEFQVRLRSGLRRVPDLLYVAPQHMDRVLDTRIEGAPDAAFEIVSRDSEMRDYQDKYSEYEEAGVPEYWIINPISQTVWLNRLNSDSKYEQVEPENGRLTSSVISGFWLKPEWLWDLPLPNLADCWRGLGVLS